VLLLHALLRRGHASQSSLQTDESRGWPSAAVRRATLRCRAQTQWSRLSPDHDGSLPDTAVHALAAALRSVIATP
jgi:hypothetical protein